MKIRIAFCNYLENQFVRTPYSIIPPIFLGERVSVVYITDQLLVICLRTLCIPFKEKLQFSIYKAIGNRFRTNGILRRRADMYAKKILTLVEHLLNLYLPIRISWIIYIYNYTRQITYTYLYLYLPTFSIQTIYLSIYLSI